MGCLLWRRSGTVVSTGPVISAAAHVAEAAPQQHDGMPSSALLPEASRRKSMPDPLGSGRRGGGGGGAMPSESCSSGANRV